MKNEETNEMTAAAGTVGEMDSFSKHLWFVLMTHSNAVKCLELGNINQNGLSMAKCGFIPVIAYNCPPELIDDVAYDGLMRIVTTLDTAPIPLGAPQVDIIDPKFSGFIAMSPYTYKFSYSIHTNNWVSVEYRENGKWIPTDLLSCKCIEELQKAEGSLAELGRETHAVLVKKEAEITELMREISSSAARFNFERAQILQARDMVQIQNLNLIKALERCSENALLEDNMALTNDLGMKQIDLEIAIDENNKIRGQMDDLKRKNDYLERVLRQHGIFNHNMPSDQPAALAA